MLQTIKRWFSGVAGSGWAGAAEWAEARRYSFKRTRDGDGFVVDAGAPGSGWRLEWGPSQRPYIQGSELRLRGDIGEIDLQMMVLSRSLMDSMEKAVFEQFTEDLQTRIDTATPEEMRWLVLFPKMPANELKMLRDSFGAAGSAPRWLAQWLAGPLSQQLQQARSSWLAPEDPLALILQRGRLTLRLAVQQPDAARLTAAAVLFDVALREARRVAQACNDNGVASTQPSMWSGSGDDGPAAR
ncbi:hypothetical protein [Ideonella sp. BN130291]|jgi:hypothetical protein|uniref:hypothetical protein n=1 Tax=Ideonella sp. BN130291 TaxID=3112940 RepID=UPI002E26BCF6|nr:hypothetical protein [Ideonella sp. BN130291]